MELVPVKWSVIPFLFFQMVSLSTLYFIVPQLVIFKVCYRTFNTTVCSHLGLRKFRAEETRVFDEAAAWNAVIHFAALCPSLIITLPLGALTDLVSKKKMLLVPAIANLASCFIKLCCSIFMNVHVGFLAIASFITSIYGEIYGCGTLGYIYSCSVTNSGDRATVLAVVTISIEFGLAIGSLVGNYLLRYYGYPSVFLFVGTGLVISLFYAVLLIPPIDDVRENSLKGEPPNVWNDFKPYIKDIWIHLVSFVKRRMLNSKDKTILLLLILPFFYVASYGGERALMPLILKHSPLSFTADKIGILIALTEISRSLGLIILVPMLEKYLGSSDYTSMFLGSISMFVSLAVLSFSKTTLMVYLSVIFAIPSAMLTPSVRSQLTKLVSAEEYGVVLSIVGLMGNIGMLIVAVGSNGLFVATVKIYPGFSLFLMASANIISIGVLLYIVCSKERGGSRHDDFNEIPSNDSDNTNDRH